MPDLSKQLVVGVLGAVLAFGVVACGDSDESPPDDSDAPPQVGS